MAETRPSVEEILFWLMKRKSSLNLPESKSHSMKKEEGRKAARWRGQEMGQKRAAGTAVTPLCACCGWGIQTTPPHTASMLCALTCCRECNMWAASFCSSYRDPIVTLLIYNVYVAQGTRKQNSYFCIEYSVGISDCFLKQPFIYNWVRRSSFAFTFFLVSMNWLCPGKSCQILCQWPALE